MLGKEQNTLAKWQQKVLYMYIDSHASIILVPLIKLLIGSYNNNQGHTRMVHPTMELSDTLYYILYTYLFLYWFIII